MSSTKTVNSELVRELAGYAELPLASGHEEVISPALELLIRNTNELSKKMSSAQYMELAPATIFKHAHETEESNGR